LNVHQDLPFEGEIFGLIGPNGARLLAGKRVFPGVMHVNLLSFAIVPTARFAQPISTAVLYPMLAACRPRSFGGSSLNAVDTALCGVLLCITKA
jgi:hypothetical protein